MEAVKEQATLKSLYTRIEKEKAEISVLQSQIRDAKAELIERHNKLNFLKKEVDKLTRDDLVLTEHAILRYMERVELVPIEEVEKRILTEELKKMWRVLGNATYPIGDTSASVIIRGNVITTVINKTPNK